MNNVADKLYNILGTKFNNTDIKTLSASGKETTDMEEIQMFSFDFLVDSRNYGPVVLLLSATDNLEVYYGDNTSKSLDRDAKKKWENLIEHLSTFARTNRLGFSLKHTSDLKYDLSNIADITESYRNIFEGYYGTRKTSYSPQGNAKIIIKHTKAISEGEKRFRNISSLFIENADGERFKLPFTKLAGARAMARHVTEGGNPYDLFGVHISEMVKDINTLGGFVRRSKMYEGNDDAMAMVETGRSHYTEMRKGLKRIAGVRGYKTYKESWEPSAITEQDLDTSKIRGLFTEKKVNQRTEDALPLLARLQQMAEAQNQSDLPRDELSKHREDHGEEPDTNDEGATYEFHPFDIEQRDSDKWHADRYAEYYEETNKQDPKMKQMNEQYEEQRTKIIVDFLTAEGHRGSFSTMTLTNVMAKAGYRMELNQLEKFLGTLADQGIIRSTGTSSGFGSTPSTTWKLGGGSPAQYEEQRTKIIVDFLTKEGHRGSFSTLTLTNVMTKAGHRMELNQLEKFLGTLADQNIIQSTGTSTGFGSTPSTTWKLGGGGMKTEGEDNVSPPTEEDNKTKDYGMITCSTCGGSGMVERSWCPECDGFGLVTPNAAEEAEMKEVTEFTQWAETIVEGTWAFADTPDALAELKEFMATERPVGIDAMNATTALYNILGNDELFDLLAEIAEENPESDARIAVKTYIEGVYRNLDSYNESDQLNIVNMYNTIIGEKMYPHEVDENCAMDLDIDDETQLNASHNKAMDDYIQKEDVDDEYPSEMARARARASARTRAMSGREDSGAYYHVTGEPGHKGTYANDMDKMSDPTGDDDEYEYDDMKSGTSSKLDESTDLVKLMSRTNFLLNR